ncbi:MAG: YdcF family protein [bacterium]|nr:YdcF family protein [bacterium]
MNTEEITNYVFLEDFDPKGDIAFVFGTWNAWKGSVEKAVEIYKKGLVPKMIFSGGLNKKYGIVEGEAMAKEAVKLGIPEKDTLAENESTNTLENVLFSIQVMDKELGLQNIKVITAIVKNYHARRALMTLRKHIPENIKLKAVPYYSEYYPFTKENWFETDIGKEKVMEEVEKIKTYLAKGDLAEL